MKFYRFIYNILFFLSLPILSLRLLFKKKYHAYWPERFGFYKIYPEKNAIQIHAVSLGEITSILPFIDALKKEYRIFVTTSTITGRQKLQQTFKNEIWYGYLPFDFASIVKRFLKKTQPQLIIFLETEIWPNYYFYADAYQIPLLTFNARISENAFKQYQKIKFFLKYVLNYPKLIACQSSYDYERFKALGADESRLKVVGNLKFSVNEPTIDPQALTEIQNVIGENRFIFIVASTHDDEEKQFIRIFKTLKAIIPNLLMVLAPRHPERFKTVEKLLRDAKLKIVTRTSGEICQPDTDVFLLNTVGELKNFYRVADLVFVGGSLVNIGGHNVLEPILFNKPVVTGKYIQNSKAVIESLEENQGIILIDDIKELKKIFQKISHHDQHILQMGLRANALLYENKDVLEKYLEIVDSYVKHNNTKT